MNRKLFAIVLGAPLLVGLAMLLYTWPSARSELRNVPVAVVAPSARIDTVVGEVQGVGGLTVHRYGGAAAAETAVRHREVDAALVESDGGVRVLVASAASPALAMQVQPALQKVAGATATVEDVVPTPATDPQGSVLGQAVLPLTLAGQLSAILLAVAVRPGLRQLVPLLGISALTGLLAVLIVDTWLDVLGPATWWIAGGAFALTVLAVGSIVLGLHALLGRAGLPVAFATLVFVGNAFSGASSAPELLPTAARRVGQWLPPGAGSELLRSVSFFHGHGAVHPVVVLGVWVLLGFAAVSVGHVLADRRTQPGRHEADGANPATQPAAG